MCIYALFWRRCVFEISRTLVLVWSTCTIMVRDGVRTRQIRGWLTLHLLILEVHCTNICIHIRQPSPIFGQPGDLFENSISLVVYFHTLYRVLYFRYRHTLSSFDRKIETFRKLILGQETSAPDQILILLGLTFNIPCRILAKFYQTAVYTTLFGVQWAAR